MAKLATATVDGWVEWPFVPLEVDYTGDGEHILVLQRARWEARQQLLVRVSLTDRQTAWTAHLLTHVDLETAGLRGSAAVVDIAVDELAQHLRAPAVKRLQIARQQVNRLAGDIGVDAGFWIRVLQATTVGQLRNLLQVSWQPDPAAALELYDTNPDGPLNSRRRSALLDLFDKAVRASKVPDDQAGPPPLWLAAAAELRQAPVMVAAEALFIPAGERPDPQAATIWVSDVVERRRRGA